MPTALITGASSGIGAEFARIHAERGGNLVITARSEDALTALKNELETAHHVSVTVIPCDLGAAGGAQRLYAAVKERDIVVDYLINNAGFGGYGLFYERDDADDQAMIDLNIRALTSLCHLFVPAMIARGAGKVLNVASTAAYVPGPYQAVYFATKAYVLSLSEAMAHELRSTGITVTALCPGPVNTNFAARADLMESSSFRDARDPHSVALCGYNAMMSGRWSVINEWQLWFLLRWIAPCLPRSVVTNLVERGMKKPKQ